MNWLSLPPLTALRAFAAFSETKSLTKAGGVLNVSHAAVSQQIRTLESRLGVRLIEKDGRGVILTNAGARFAQELRDGFEVIYRAVNTLTDQDKNRPLQITMTPSFASNWLMPRLSDFRKSHPGVDLMVNPTTEVVELHPGGVDLAIRFGDGKWQGVETERLLKTEFVIVGAPELVHGNALQSPEDFAKLPWLQEMGTNEVSHWLEAQGVTDASSLRITHLPGYMVLDALRKGDGVAATARSFVQQEIDTGALELLYENTSEAAGYYIVRLGGVERPPLKTFVKWLKAQVQA